MAVSLIPEILEVVESRRILLRSGEGGRTEQIWEIWCSEYDSVDIGEIPLVENLLMDFDGPLVTLRTGVMQQARICVVSVQCQRECPDVVQYSGGISFTTGRHRWWWQAIGTGGGSRPAVEVLPVVEVLQCRLRF